MRRELDKVELSSTLSIRRAHGEVKFGGCNVAQKRGSIDALQY